MFYFDCGYEFEKCLDIECTLCPRRTECVNFTPEEEYPPQDEYRLFTPLDDTSGELLRNIARRLSRLGYPWRESYILTMAWYLLGYQVKDLLELIISRGMHPLEIEKIVFSLLRDEFRVYIAELVEHGVLEVDIEDLEDPDSSQWIDFLIQMRVRNFTGEVRLGPPEEEEPQEEHIPPEVQKLIDEALRWASSVRRARTGRYAYLFSQKSKNLIEQLPPDWAEVVRKRLKEAWEEWKSSHAKKK